MTSGDTKGLVEFVARNLVDHPDQVRVIEIEGEQNTILELRVAPEDLGKVIGRQGRTARALRVVLNAVASKKHKRSIMEIRE
ncbi:MAG: RNA-binding protein [Deltaproteobacteria bacterium RBG_13_61_14]|nr:MAG: RNA-binding protein [Deltaproteobacteria bacterium RBG_13_61_14]